MLWSVNPLRKISALLNRSALDRQMSEEISIHLQMQTDAHVEAGMTENEARFAAQRDFGHIEGIKEKARDRRGVRWIGDVERDLRYGVRQLRKSPSFTAVAIVSLAISIGVCTAVFSAARGILWRPMAFAGQGTLVFIETALPRVADLNKIPRPGISEWRGATSSFVDFAAFRGAVHIMNDPGASPIRVWSTEVTSNFFTLLGAEPLLGRTIRETDASPQAPRVAVLSYAFWKRERSGRPDIVGKSLRLDNQTVTIVGVMPMEFQLRGRDNPIIYTPTRSAESLTGDNNPRSVSVLGRVKAGITLKAAADELTSLSNQMTSSAREAAAPWTIRLIPLLDATVREVRPTLLLLLGMAGALLLMAQVNIAGLLYVRAGARRKEIALRMALGANGGRVLRQVFCESFLLVGIGGVLGACLAQVVLSILLRVAPEMPRASGVAIDGIALAFATALTVFSALICGTSSALRSRRVQVSESLKAEGAGLSEEPSRLRSRSLFVMIEVALALMLLVASGLLVRSFIRLSWVDPGFDAKDVYRNRLTLLPERYPTPSSRVEFVARLSDRLSKTPGVESFAVTTSLPFDGNARAADAARGVKRREWNVFMERAAITPSYFDVLKITLKRGRGFTAADDAAAPAVAIVSENLAQLFFPGVDPIGQRIPDRSKPGSLREIVGVVGNVKQAGLQLQSTPQLYVPYAQSNDHVIGTHLVFRSKAPVRDVGSALVSVVHDLDKELPFDLPWSLAGSISRSLELRFATVLFGIFSVAAICLAIVGIYGVVYYSVSQRVYEIGIRRALGAQTRDVLRLVFSTGGRPVAIGLLAGIVGALAMSRFLRFILFEVSSHDPITFAIVVPLLAIVALLACWLPAREATKIDPQVTLRHP